MPTNSYLNFHTAGIRINSLSYRVALANKPLNHLSFTFNLMTLCLKLKIENTNKRGPSELLLYWITEFRATGRFTELSIVLETFQLILLLNT